MLGFVAATGAIDYLTDPNLLLNTTRRLDGGGGRPDCVY